MKLTITVDGRTYEVDVEATEPDPPRQVAVLPAAARPPGPAAVVPPPAPGPADAVPDESKVCRSPLSGTVVRVVAQPGQSLQQGDVMLVLEAMKMETKITAPAAAEVARVPVAPGDAVRTGQVLVQFE